MGSHVLNPEQLCARQVTYPLYYLSGSMISLLNFTFSFIKKMLFLAFWVWIWVSYVEGICASHCTIWSDPVIFLLNVIFCVYKENAILTVLVLENWLDLDPLLLSFTGLLFPFSSYFLPPFQAEFVTFTITQLPRHGTIERAGSEPRSQHTSTFTMDDIYQNRISYSHDGSNSLKDRFTFTVTDGTNPFFIVQEGGKKVRQRGRSNKACRGVRLKGYLDKWRVLWALVL